ncbi:ABC transporter ATP-binding protein [uncultured Actinomyces sp.]|uniref:ABC transporter ATP-binding protein n=1 Tax=uncultured Actinomyces sp. TaxID=249061 RepID=UPI0028E289D0|nr:ABC transporter ATP-binding protein [uncultured Actinomyces sp.]
MPTPPPVQPSTTQAPTEAQPPALAIRGLVKIFGNLVAVANLSLDIPKGSFYGFVGPNGAGKTTTLNMATGLLTPDQGTAYVNGIDVWKDDHAARAQLGVMPDGMRLLDRLSGPDFLVHVGMLRGLDRETARQRAHQLLDTLDLTDAGKKLISDYSAGMTKKISLAAALIHAPSLLVLDEPFEAVDPVSAANIRQILQDFTSRGGTVILSSHVMATVQQLCTHVAVINHGQVLASGTTEEVAAGMSLDERFAQLVGGVHTSEGLSWLAN